MDSLDILNPPVSTGVANSSKAYKYTVEMLLYIQNN